MNILGFSSAEAGGGDADFTNIVAESICTKELKISQDDCETVEYTLPQVGPSGDGQVIIGDANGATVWSELPSISNVEQRRILDEEIGLETFQQTANFSNAYNNFWKVLNGNDETIYSSLVVCPNDAFRVFAYNNPPVTTGDQYKGANMAGGDGFAGGVDIYSHLYKDYDLSSFNDIPYDEVELEVWLGTSGVPAYSYNVYIDIITSGSLPPAPVFNVQYSGVSPAVETGINTPNNRIERYSYKLNQQVICQASKLRVVFEAVTQTGGFLANEYQTNTLGNTCTRFRLSGLFTSSSLGTVIPPALIDHDVLIGAIGRQTHDQIDAELTTINNDITTINNDLTGKLNIDGSNAMTGNLDIGTNDIINLNKASLANGSIGDLGLDLQVVSSANILLSASNVDMGGELNMNNNSISWDGGNATLDYITSNLYINANSIAEIQANDNIILNSSDLLNLLSVNQMTIRSSNDDVKIRANLGDILIEPVVGNVIINELTNSYKLPATRGTAGQVITDTLGDGELSWGDNVAVLPQPLATGDSPSFVNMNLEDGDLTINRTVETNNHGVKFTTTGLSAYEWFIRQQNEGSGLELRDSDGLNIGFSKTRTRFKGQLETNINTSNSFLFPATRGLAGNILVDVLGDGVLSWQNSQGIFDQPLNTTDDVEFNSVTTTDLDGGPVLSIGATTSQLNLGQSGINILANGTLDCKEDIECDGNILVADGGLIQLGTTSTPSQDKCISMLFLAGATFGKGRVLKIIDDAGTAKVVPILPTDADATGVIGINMEAATLNNNVSLCIGGIFEACVQNGITINIGDKLEKSDTVGEDGKVFGTAPTVGSPGQFGVALSSGTGDVGGTVFIRGIYTKNEAF